MLKRNMLLFLATAATLCMRAAEADSLSRWGVEVSAGPSRVLAPDRYCSMFLQNRHADTYDIRFHFTSLPQDSDAFAQDYHYPTLGVGLKFNRTDVTMHRSAAPDWGMAEPVDYHSRLGNQWALYGSFTRPLWHWRRLMADYSLNFGVAYSHLKYSKADNIDNELIGSRWLFYCNFGLHATWRVARDWGLKGGAEFYHFSNGTLNRPNKGANFFSPVVGLVYMPCYEQVYAHRHRPFAAPFHRYWYLDFAVGIGAKVPDEDWQLTQFGTPSTSPDYRRGRFCVYAAYSLQASLMRRYARRWASGAGLDVFYGTYSGHIASLDVAAGRQLSHSPWSMGLAARHEVYYHQLSLSLSLGAYIYRRMGHGAKLVEKPYYERLGIHYTFRRFNDLRVGVNIKAHLTKADFSEVVVGIPVRL